MNTQKIIYRVVTPIVGAEPMLCGLGEYPGQQHTTRLNAALNVFEACAEHCHVVLQELEMHSGNWVYVDGHAMLRQRNTQAARNQAQADAGRVIELRAQIEMLQDALADAEQKAAASKRAAVALMGEAGTPC